MTLPPEMVMVTRDDQLLFGFQSFSVLYMYCLIFASQKFAICWIPSPWGVLDVKGVLESPCVVVEARAPWIWPIPSRRCNTDSLNIGLR